MGLIWLRKIDEIDCLRSVQLALAIVLSTPVIPPSGSLHISFGVKNVVVLQAFYLKCKSDLLLKLAVIINLSLGG